MAARLPPLNALRAFEAAARHLSVKKAAIELNVTPAAVSHQIRMLEDYLGVQLFHRYNRALEVTDAADVEKEAYRQEEMAGSGNVLIGYGTSGHSGGTRRRKPVRVAVAASAVASPPTRTGPVAVRTRRASSVSDSSVVMSPARWPVSTAATSFPTCPRASLE